MKLQLMNEAPKTQPQPVKRTANKSAIPKPKIAAEDEEMPALKLKLKQK